MERNPNEGLGQGAGQSGQGGSFGNVGDVTGSQGYGAGTSGGAGGYGGTTTGGGVGAGEAGGAGGAGASEFSGSGSQGFGGQSGAQGLGDRAKGALSGAQSKVQGGASTVRERAGELKASLADRLEAGAERLRSQSQGGQYDGAVAADQGQLTDRLATGMKASADWLREADIDGLKTGIEGQVKNHPGRTLVIALGLGYLLGKAFRR